MRYKNWTDLFLRWILGATDIFPARSSWQYRVEGDILIHKTSLRGGGFREEGVGWPIGAPPNRMFAYLTNQWRLRAQDRVDLEAMGGIPILDAEMNHLLIQAGRRDLVAWVDDPLDWVALKFLHAWVRARGALVDGINWRGGRLESAGGVLSLSRKPRGRILKRSQVATFSPPGGGTLGVVAQVCRSPLASWAKDALYCVVSREPGRLAVERLGQAGCGPSRKTGGSHQIKQVPPFILASWPFEISGKATFPI